MSRSTRNSLNGTAKKKKKSVHGSHFHPLPLLNEITSVMQWRHVYSFHAGALPRHPAPPSGHAGRHLYFLNKTGQWIKPWPFRSDLATSAAAPSPLLLRIPSPTPLPFRRLPAPYPPFAYDGTLHQPLPISYAELPWGITSFPPAWNQSGSRVKSTPLSPLQASLRVLLAHDPGKRRTASPLTVALFVGCRALPGGGARLGCGDRGVP